MDRREYLKRLAAPLALGNAAWFVAAAAGCSTSPIRREALFAARHLTGPGSFPRGAEGPAVDAEGNVYAVNFGRQGTIGRVAPSGAATLFLELPGGSIANGARFDSRGQLFVADYVNHNVLKVLPGPQSIEVHAHDPRMNQPNDLAIGANDLVYASDPNWMAGTGQIWRIDTSGRTSLLESAMGTTNGIEVGADEATLYVNESAQRRVWAYDLSSTGELSGKRLLISFADGGMDGMRCDIDGRLFIARHGLGLVAVVSAAGEVLREIPLAAGRNCTNIAFGGPDGRTVYVTVSDTGNLQTFRTDRPGREWALSRRARS